MALDPRRHAYRPDCADIALKGQVVAKRFVAGRKMQIKAPVADLFPTAKTGAITSQLLYGEVVSVFDQAGDLAWVQNARDGYVGHVRKSDLGPVHASDLMIIAPMAQIYAAPDFKSPVVATLPLLARLCERSRAGAFIETELGFVHRRHVNAIVGDAVSFAEMFIGSPYRWGGRSYGGLDCSGLVQLALMAAGHDCPRDSDMQEKEIGTVLPDIAPLQRGDLLFWRGHVGIMVDQNTLLHANAFHMGTVTEPVTPAIKRIEAQGDGPVTARKRPGA